MPTTNKRGYEVPFPDEVDFEALSPEARDALKRFAVPIALGLTRAEVAARAGVSLEAASRHMRLLREEIRAQLPPAVASLSFTVTRAGGERAAAPPQTNGSHGSPRSGPVPDVGEPVWGEVTVSWTEPTVPPGTRAAKLREMGKRVRKAKPPRPCDHCGQTFKPTTSRQRYCCRECGKMAQRPPERPCARCGETFRPARPSSRYCSQGCVSLTGSDAARRKRQAEAS